MGTDPSFTQIGRWTTLRERGEANLKSSCLPLLWHSFKKISKWKNKNASWHLSCQSYAFRVCIRPWPRRRNTPQSLFVFFLSGPRFVNRCALISSLSPSCGQGGRSNFPAPPDSAPTPCSPCPPLCSSFLSLSLSRFLYPDSHSTVTESIRWLREQLRARTLSPSADQCTQPPGEWPPDPHQILLPLRTEVYANGSQHPHPLPSPPCTRDQHPPPRKKRRGGESLAVIRQRE